MKAKTILLAVATFATGCDGAPPSQTKAAMTSSAPPLRAPDVGLPANSSQANADVMHMVVANDEQKAVAIGGTVEGGAPERNVTVSFEGRPPIRAPVTER